MLNSGHFVWSVINISPIVVYNNNLLNKHLLYFYNSMPVSMLGAKDTMMKEKKTDIQLEEIDYEKAKQIFVNIDYEKSMKKCNDILQSKWVEA